MRKIWLPIMALLILSGNAAAQEGAEKKIAAPTYEYLKPRAEADNSDFNQIYYQTTLNGVTAITSVSLEANYLVFHYFLKNNVDRKSTIKLDDIQLLYIGKALKLFEGRFLPKDENNPAGGVTLGLTELKGECSMEMGEYCTGDVYTTIPGQFASGAVLTIRLPVEPKVLENDFIYEQDWMTGQSYRQLRDAARQKESK